MAAKKTSSSSISYSDLVAQIRNKQYAPVYLLQGEEPFFIDRITKMFEEEILEPEERDFNQVVLYGKDTTADMVLANAKQFPFGSPYRVVILKEAKELKKIELLDSYAENPSPQTILVVCHKYGKLKAAQTKAYAKHGVVAATSNHSREPFLRLVKTWKPPPGPMRTAAFASSSGRNPSASSGASKEIVESIVTHLSADGLLAW